MQSCTAVFVHKTMYTIFRFWVWKKETLHKLIQMHTCLIIPWMNYMAFLFHFLTFKKHIFYYLSIYCFHFLVTNMEN